MLRAVIAGAAILFVAGAFVLTLAHPPGWPVLATALLLALGCLFERRYHAGRSGLPPEPGFRPSGERFVDPETRRVTTVWVHHVTGERRYVAEGEPPASAL